VVVKGLDDDGNTWGERMTWEERERKNKLLFDCKRTAASDGWTKKS